jgi:hypothetical protein
LSGEIQGLEALEYQMSRSLEALRNCREAVLFLGGRLFAAYCVSRIVTVSELRATVGHVTDVHAAVDLEFADAQG